MAGTIPAGATSAVLAVQTNCGQVDVKAVFTGNGDARGRVAGPYITTADDCTSTPTTRATTVPPTTGPTTGPTTSTRRFHDPELGGRHDAARRQHHPDLLRQARRSATARCPRRAPTARCCSSVSAALVVAGVVLVTKGRDRDTLPE